jgi:Protein of unknown function (DUF2510)
MADAGWKQDPNGRHEWRYFDGVAWTDKVSDAGTTSSDPYDPEVVPAPPSVSPTAVAAATEPRRVSYRLLLLDRKGQTIHKAPYQSADQAMHFAQENPQLRLPHSLGSVLLKGAMRPNIVRWKTALIVEIDADTGEEREYHRIKH